MAKRTLQELNLLDDFLFGTMLTYPEIGEKFIRELLRIIFHREFGNLNIVSQKTYYGSNTDKHGARLDVYVEECADGLPGNATVYDVEPDKNDDSESITALPKRTRFYHAKIDAVSLKSGESYHSLKNVIVVIITPYDPFGLGRMVYTIQSRCAEVPEMPYDDGARTLYLYTRGTEGNPPKELAELLHYMEHTTEENAKNTTLRTIQQMVTKIKYDGEVSLEYMKILEREEMLIRRGYKEGQKAEQANTEREKQRADMEKTRADMEKNKADTEKARADAAEKELLRLREELKRLQNK